jgi:hypothetical protein
VRCLCARVRTTHSCLRAAWQLLPPPQQASAAPAVVGVARGLMAASGFSWSAWLAVVQLASSLIASAAPAARASGTSGLPVVLVPLAGGLVHVLQHSTVSQVCGCRGWPAGVVVVL